MDAFADAIVRLSKKDLPDKSLPKKKAAPKKAPKRAAARGLGVAGMSSEVARRQTSPKKVVRRTARAGRRAPTVDEIERILAKHDRIADRGPSRSLDEAFARAERGGSSDEILEIIDKHTRNTPPAKGRNALGFRTSGFDPELLKGRDEDPIGGFLKNLGRGAVRTVVDTPAGLQLAGEALVYPVVAGVNFARGDRPGPKKRRGGTGARLSRAIEERTREDLVRAGQGIRADYAHRYGPLVQGDFATFGRRFYEDPLPTILDVGGAYAAAGRAPGVVARAGSRVTAGRASAALARAGDRSIVGAGEIDPATGTVRTRPGKLHRPPRRVTGRTSYESERGKAIRGERTLEVPRRPYSPNVITRSVQRGADRLRERVGPRVEAMAERHQSAPGATRGADDRVAGFLARPFTSQGRFDSAIRRQTRDLIDVRTQRAAAVAARESQPFLRAVKELKPARTATGAKVLGVEGAALRLHLEDLLSPRGGLSPRQLRDRLASRIEQGIRKAEAKGERTAGARRNLDLIRSIPAELLDLHGDTPTVARMRRALDEGRKLDEVSQARSIRAGVVTQQTARAAQSRTSELLLGGAEWAPAVLKEMKRAGASKAERAAVRASAIAETPKLAEARAALAGAEQRLADVTARSNGRVPGRSASITPTQVPGMPLVGQAATVARKPATPAAIKAATRKRDKYAKAVKAQEDRALGFTPPTRPELVGDRGVYIPKRPVDPMGGGGPSGRRGFSGPTKAKRSTGYLTQKGGFDLNPALLAHQARRAAGHEVGPMSNEALNEFIGLAAYRDAKGEFLTGKRAAQMARTDPDRVVLVNVGSLRKTLRKLDELEEGKFLEPSDVRMFHGEGRESWLQAIPERAIGTDYVAISKAAADVWREAPTTNPILRAHDNLMAYWKGSLLAISPRWLANNLVGVATQYGLLAGPDIRSIRQANRLGPIRDAIPSRVALNTLAEDVGFHGKIDANRIERILTAGFRVNNRLESGWRRAAYLNRAKHYLGRERVKTRGLSDAELARALDAMPESIARQIIRDVDLYLGDFRKFNRFEREVVKRAVPFWSWLRCIARLTFSLPFRSPLRAQALAVLGRAGEYGINPEDYQRPLYERGAIVFGDYRVPTTGLNPFATLAEPISAAARLADDPGGGIGAGIATGLQWSNPAIQLGASQAFGTTSFGQPVIAPAGYGDTVSGFGGSRMVDPITGLPERTNVRVPFQEALLQSAVPFIAGTARKALAAGDRPFDTSTTLDLALDRLTGGNRRDLYLDPPKIPYRYPVANGLLGPLGAPVYREDRDALKRRYDKALREFKQALRATEARKRREARR